MTSLSISPRVLLLPVFFLLPPPIRAYTSFQPTCSVPNETVHFVASAGVRGTFDILWSCLFTILACTWSIQHLNIPEQRDRRKGTSKQWGTTTWYDTEWVMKRFWANIKWMVNAILAPVMINDPGESHRALDGIVAQHIEHRRTNHELNLHHSYGVYLIPK